MFNRSEIMKAAWRKIRQRYTIANRYVGPSDWSDALAWALKAAWRDAKEAHHKADIAIKEAQRMAALTVKDREAQIAHLQGRIEDLRYRPLSHNIQRERRSLEKQIAALAA